MAFTLLTSPAGNFNAAQMIFFVSSSSISESFRHNERLEFLMTSKPPPCLRVSSVACKLCMGMPPIYRRSIILILVGQLRRFVLVCRRRPAVGILSSMVLLSWSLVVRREPCHKAHYTLGYLRSVLRLCPEHPRK